MPMQLPINAVGDVQALEQTCVALKLQLSQRRSAFYAHRGVDIGTLLTPDAAQHEFESGVQDAIKRYFGEEVEPAPRPVAGLDAPVWLVSLESTARRPAQVLVCSMGSENDVREIARVHMGRGWSTLTADRTSQRGQAGYVARASLPPVFGRAATATPSPETAAGPRRRARP